MQRWVRGCDIRGKEKGRSNKGKENERMAGYYLTLARYGCRGKRFVAGPAVLT